MNANLTLEHVRAAIRQVRAEFLSTKLNHRGEPSSLFEINCGDCGDFADQVEAALVAKFPESFPNYEVFLDVDNDNFRIDDVEGVNRWDQNLLLKYWKIQCPEGFTWKQLNAIDFGQHVWLAARVGKDGTWMHFDAECEEGVASFFGLPLFQRYLQSTWPTLEEVRAFPLDKVWPPAPKVVAELEPMHMSSRAQALSTHIGMLEGVVLVFEDYTETEVELVNIKVERQGFGHGSRVMRTVVAAADTLGINLMLIPAGRTSDQRDRLCRFYERFGFDRDGDVMRRRGAPRPLMAGQDS